VLATHCTHFGTAAPQTRRGAGAVLGWVARCRLVASVADAAVPLRALGAHGHCTQERPVSQCGVCRQRRTVVVEVHFRRDAGVLRRAGLAGAAVEGCTHARRRCSLHAAVAVCTRRTRSPRRRCESGWQVRVGAIGVREAGDAHLRVAPTKQRGVGAAQSASAGTADHAGIRRAAHLAAAHCVSSTQASMTPGLPLLPACSRRGGVDAQSFSVVQVVALACRRRSAPDRRPGRKDSRVLQRRLRRRPTGRQCGVGGRSRCRWRRRRRSGARRSQVGAEMLGQSPESRHSTQARCCTSPDRRRLDAVPVRGAAGEREQTWSLHCLPGRSRARAGRRRTRLADIADRRLRGAEQSASRAQVPDSPGTQQPLAQCWPPPQAASSLQAAEPMQKRSQRTVRPRTSAARDSRCCRCRAARRAVGTARTSAMSSRRELVDFNREASLTAHQPRYDIWRSRSRRSGRRRRLFRHVRSSAGPESSAL